VLYGNAGVASTLVAGSGAEILLVTGTAGTILTGGTGHDTFAFPNVMGHDEVTNFGIARDTLHGKHARLRDENCSSPPPKFTFSRMLQCTVGVRSGSKSTDF
jgi:hypothetical protein